MNIMLHYIQFTVYVVISTKLNPGFNKKRTIFMKLPIVSCCIWKQLLYSKYCVIQSRPKCYLLYFYLTVAES